MSRDIYNSFESSYGSDSSSTDVLEKPVKTKKSSGLDNRFLDDVESVVTKNKTLAKDYNQYSGE